ncbi:putative enzyme with alpha/beta-Hydrolase domain [Xenorhabdus nematophila ATCC 19061]|uniref:Enzyme with alpha/beta-Hydrolase domain n=1 Tax=Xenorhabdus nematophila (strain ATCC 19061 / DSM 3370 / CCUG 14189 / LMG 1036 / NCIMB 9965 / AN6) TaxID=406817 RepID=D3VAL2_XENNA|nr:esterase [Xenorhabdus nematophila]CBJ89448.1 putative enzyme with alpha/beta-Hydrolase domain [Xenorhabdus nematophila ATCC 19061]CEK22341.1 putative enzyme with alpha/beta-Hydrolase domain [Xenorhabdus nematophila AN6/1]
MKSNSQLNYHFHIPENPQSATPIVLIHGLFGDLNNLGILGRDLQQHYPVIQIDVRNHGISPRMENMDYRDMAQDVLTLLDELNVPKATIIGHSMGGKIAMTMTAIAPERIEKIVVIDIAPIAYPVHRHDSIFSALNKVTAAGAATRQIAADIMRQDIREEGVIQFLLKSFRQGEWKFNLPVLQQEYEKIISWETIPAWHKPVLFIRGGNSDYITEEYRDDIIRQFPQATAWVIAGSGHWVHAEKPEAVLRAIHRFL